MGGLFDFDNFSLKDVLLDPITKPIEGTKSIINNVKEGDFKGILGDNQDISTEALKNLGFNPDNKLVKNSDAIAGTVVGGILAAPAIAGALGTGSASATGATGSVGGSALGTTSGASSAPGALGSGGFDYTQLMKLGMNQMSGQPQQPQQQQPAMMPYIPQGNVGGDNLGKGLSYDRLMNLYR